MEFKTSLNIHEKNDMSRINVHATIEFLKFRTSLNIHEINDMSRINVHGTILNS
jgi:hypothetical protein